MSLFSAKWLHGKWWLFFMTVCMFCVCCRLLPHHVKWRTDHYDKLSGHSDSVCSNSHTNILWERDLWLTIDSLWSIRICPMYLCNFLWVFGYLLLPYWGSKKRPSLPSFGDHPWVLSVTCLKPLALGKWGVNWCLKMLFPVSLNISR